MSRVAREIAGRRQRGRAERERRSIGGSIIPIEELLSIVSNLYRADDSVAMPLCHDPDLAAVRAGSRADVALDHRSVTFLHDYGPEFPAFAGRRLVAPCARALRQDPLERLAELCVEDAVDDWVEGRVAVAEPSEYLSHNDPPLYQSLLRYYRRAFCNGRNISFDTGRKMIEFRIEHYSCYGVVRAANRMLALWRSVILDSNNGAKFETVLCKYTE